MQPPIARTASELDDLLGRFLYRYRRIGAFNLPKVALSFCEKFGLHEFPRDPRVYLPQFGVTLQPDSLPRGVRAVWMRVGGQYIVRHSMHLTGRLNLVLWHEFFEIMSANPRFPSRLAPEVEEKLATQFAVLLMMPDEEVRAEAAKLGHPALQNKTRVLASRFGVSASAMTLRLRELGLSPKSGRWEAGYG